MIENHINQRLSSASYTALSACAGSFGDAVWESLKCQTTTPAVHVTQRISYKLAVHIQTTSAPEYVCSYITTTDRWGHLQVHVLSYRSEGSTNVRSECRSVSTNLLKLSASGARLSDTVATFKRQLKKRHLLTVLLTLTVCYHPSLLTKRLSVSRRLIALYKSRCIVSQRSECRINAQGICAISYCRWLIRYDKQ